MDWYLVHTKPRQEKCALENLERQGYQCYLPVIRSEKLQGGQVVVGDEPLFPRYLFIQLETGQSAKSWSHVRYTRGVARLVTFGAEPAKINGGLVAELQAREEAMKNKPRELFNHGERVLLNEPPFNGIEAIYQMKDGDERVIVLIELLSRSIAMRVNPSEVRKIG